MKILDYFFNKCAKPTLETLSDFGFLILSFVAILLNFLMTTVIYITLPVWLIPYYIWKKKHK